MGCPSGIEGGSDGAEVSLERGGVINATLEEFSDQQLASFDAMRSRLSEIVAVLSVLSAKTPSGTCWEMLVAVVGAWSKVTLLSIQYLWIQRRTSWRKVERAAFGV